MTHNEPASSPLMLLISAPSGAGKTTVCEQLLQTTPGLARAITCTTRSPRAGEVDGKDYYFLDDATFQSRQASGDFLESAQVYGKRYGTLRSEVLTRLGQGQDVLLNIDVQGAKTIRAKARTDAELAKVLVTVFLAPVSLEVLAERLAKRGKDAPEVIQTRLQAARQELACWRDYDYLVLSTSIEEDLRRMRTIYEAEKRRVSRYITAPFSAG